jgi:hypothetical protein
LIYVSQSNESNYIIVSFSYYLNFVLKARYCARGFEQVEGIDYFETFDPVVMWLTVRLLLIMSILLKLETTQIDYTAAFIHAGIDCLVYVAMPPCFGVPGQVWKLRKSLYGLAQSPINSFLYTRDKLTKMGSMSIHLC